MTRRPWTEQEIATLRRLYAETPTTELAEHFGRSLKIVYEKAKRLGLRKAPHYMREQHGARAQHRCTRQAIRLRRGRVRVRDAQQ